MPDVCVRCVESGHGCCHVNPKLRESQLPITFPDLLRIVDATGVSEGEAATIQRTDEQFEGNCFHFSSFLSAAVSSGCTLRLKLDACGQCVFLDPGLGCTLGDKRPAICRMYPFFVDSDGKVRLLFDQQCLAAKEAEGDPLKVLELLGQSKEEVLRTAEQYKQDLQLHADMANRVQEKD